MKNKISYLGIALVSVFILLFGIVFTRTKIIDFNNAAQLCFGGKYQIRRNQDIKKFMDSLKIKNLDTNKFPDYIQMSLEQKIQ